MVVVFELCAGRTFDLWWSWSLHSRYHDDSKLTLFWGWNFLFFPESVSLLSMYILNWLDDDGQRGKRQTHLTNWTTKYNDNGIGCSPRNAYSGWRILLTSRLCNQTILLLFGVFLFCIYITTRNGIFRRRCYFYCQEGVSVFRSFQQIELVMNFYINLTVPFELDFW